MSLNPPAQYATDTNLRARQRLWGEQRPPFDLVAWVLDLAGVDGSSEQRVLDVGCGNGAYLRAMAERGVGAIGCDLSLGMLSSAGVGERLVNADVTRLPFPAAAFDVVLAPHMLYHVPDREAAVRELRRVLTPHGRCVAVTNGEGHLRELRAVVEPAVARATPGWEMRGPSLSAFSLESGAGQLGVAFERVECLRPAGSAAVAVADASIVADYVASLGDHYQPEVARPWSDVVEEVRAAVQREIDRTGSFTVTGVTGAFVCS